MRVPLVRTPHDARYPTTRIGRTPRDAVSTVGADVHAAESASMTKERRLSLTGYQLVLILNMGLPS